MFILLTFANKKNGVYCSAFQEPRWVSERNWRFSGVWPPKRRLNRDKDDRKAEGRRYHHFRRKVFQDSGRYSRRGITAQLRVLCPSSRDGAVVRNEFFFNKMYSQNARCIFVLWQTLLALMPRVRYAWSWMSPVELRSVSFNFRWSSLLLWSEWSALWRRASFLHWYTTGAEKSKTNINFFKFLSEKNDRSIHLPPRVSLWCPGSGKRRTRPSLSAVVKTDCFLIER